MSKALRCDRCNKCFVPEEAVGAMMRFRNPAIYEAANLANPLAPTCTYFLHDEAPDANLDLCPSCTTDFVLFMHKFRPVAEITDPLVEKDGV